MMKSKIMYSSLWVQVLLCLSVATIESHDDSHPLCYYLKTPIIKQINVTLGNLMDNNSTERCSKPTDSCYILWQEDPKNKTITIISQGCWNDANQKCQQNECIPDRKPKSSKARDNTHFCCCNGNFCNTNITDIKNVSESFVDDPSLQFLGHMSYTMHVVIISIIVLVLGLMVISVYFIHRMYCILPKRSNESLHLMESAPPCLSYDLDTLKIQESIARGRYGCVFRGCLNDQSVAVKIFSFQNQQHFLNERAIYILPHMDHSCLSKFIGSKEQIGEDGRLEFLLVVSFSPLGCLKDYLRANTIDWNSLCKILLSISRGLAHLHSEIKKGDKSKPCIVHRDLTSRNILVKVDGTCVLCDFGYAIQIAGSKYMLNGIQVKAEESSLSDVGTLRYMAPEILEGAVNLRDCESSLKQTDVYALGLVMWEVASRCMDLYQGVEVPPYKLPFEAEIGQEPSMEQMQNLVVRHKSRPLFPDIWKITNPAIRSLTETIEDCWDQDAEARLTSLCVEERVSELPVLWEWHKAGLNIPGGISPSLHCNLQKSISILNKNGSELTLEDQLICPRERVNSLSECTTDTLLSPSEIVDKNNLLNKIPHLIAPQVTYPLQPHQGRNPSLARNLMSDVQEESMPCNGSLKYPNTTKLTSFSDGDANIFDLPPGMESAMMPNTRSGRVVNPIPILQNPVGSGAALKQSNLKSRSAKDFFEKEERRWNPLTFFDRKNIKASLKSLLDRKSSSSHANVPEEQQPLKSSNINSPVSPSGKGGQTNPFWNSLAVRENCDENITTSGTVSANGYKTSDNSEWNSKEGKCSSQCMMSESLSSPIKVKEIKSMSCDNHHLLNGDTAVGKSSLSLTDKSKRPTTLLVQPSNSANEEEFEDVMVDDTSECLDTKPQCPVVIRRKNGGSKKKGVKRVKTPFEIKGRFSLYDDRIMSSQELPSSSKDSNSPQLNSAKFSISVPHDMNTLCSSNPECTVHDSDSQNHTSKTNTHVYSTNQSVQRSSHSSIIPLCDI